MRIHLLGALVSGGIACGAHVTTGSPVPAGHVGTCALGADALVAPLPPESFVTAEGASARLAGTFIRRCPASGCPASQAAR